MASPTARLVKVFLHNKKRRRPGPLFDPRATYLVRVDGAWRLGKFTQAWHGWEFTGADGVSRRFDGGDGSKFERVYLLVHRAPRPSEAGIKRKRKRKNPPEKTAG